MRRPSKDAADSARMITRRALIIGGLQVGMVGALAFRMQSLQIDQADQFLLLSDENRINIRLIPPARGLIFDAKGVPLAENAQTYRIVIVREDAGDVEEVLRRLTNIVPIDPDLIARAMEEMERRSAFVPVTIIDRVPWEDVARVTVNAPALPGITAEL